MVVPLLVQIVLLDPIQQHEQQAVRTVLLEPIHRQELQAAVPVPQDIPQQRGLRLKAVVISMYLLESILQLQIPLLRQIVQLGNIKLLIR
jgi:hypothetical protein